MVNPMVRIILAAALAFGITLTAAAQDPTKTLPESYKVTFENDHVRVVRVHYDAGARLPEHTHPAGTTAYVYLNDSDGIVFKHVGGSNSQVTRPPVKTGAVRIATGREEHHTAENTSSTPTDFLRIYFKTADGGVKNLRRRMPATDDQFSNEQMRVTRLRIAPHQTLELAGKEPALVIEIPSGDERWIAAGEKTIITNHDARPLELVRFDFLTKPQR
jgi:hypothetical protein